MTATKCLAMGDPRGLEGRGRLELAVACLEGAPGLGDDDDDRAPELGADLREHVVHPVGVGVVEEAHLQLVPPGLAEGVADELRPEGRSPDPDDQERG